MKRPEEGSIAPQFMILLLLVSSLTLGAGMLISETQLMQKKAIERDTEREKILVLLDTIYGDFYEDPTPDVDSADDPIQSWNGATRDGYAIAIRSLSSRLNPNFIRKNILQDTQLIRLLTPGKSPDDLQQLREDNGLSLRDDAYGDIFDNATFERYLSCYGWANINTIDEFSARSLAKLITGSDSVAEATRQKIVAAIRSDECIDRNKIAEILGSDYDSLYPFINAEPSMNVNFVDPDVFREILAYPGYKLESPLGKADMLLSLRSGDGVSEQDIVNVLGIDSKHRLYHYFGSITWFWEITIAGNNRQFVAIVVRYPPKNGTIDEKPTFGVIEARFVK